MNKSIFIPLLVSFSFIIVACSKKIDKDKLQIRNGVAYEINSQVPFSGKAVKYFDEDKKKLKAEENYDDGLKYGLSVTYYENGQKQMESNYVRGKLSGKETMWRENGMVSTVVEFDTTRLVHVVQGFDENGKPKSPSFETFAPCRFWEKLLLMSEFGKEYIDKELKLPKNDVGTYGFILVDEKRPLVGAAGIIPNEDGFTAVIGEGDTYQVTEALRNCNYSFYESPKDKNYTLYRNESLKRQASLSGSMGGQVIFTLHLIGNETSK